MVDDAEFAVTADQVDSSLQIRVEDTTGDRNPSALGLYVYDESIPRDLATESKSEFSRDGISSVMVSAHDLKQGVYYAVVRCISVSAASYRIVAQLTPAYVGSRSVQGTLCDGGLAYHYTSLDGPAAQLTGHGRRQLTGTSGTHARFFVRLYTGDAYYITQHGSVPLKLIPPYGHVDASDPNGIITDACNVSQGGRAYIGLKSTRGCADYEVSVEWFEGPCEPMEFDAAVEDRVFRPVELQPHHFVLGSCEPHSYVDYQLAISEEDARHLNLEFELEDLSKTLDTSALAMYLYRGSIPEDRRTEWFSDFTNDGTYSLAVSMLDLQPTGAHKF